MEFQPRVEDMKVSFSLANKAKSATTTAGAAPPLKQPAAFGSLDDEPIDAAPTATNTGFTRGNKAYIAQNAPSSSRAKKKIKAEMEVDASVYEYDAVWDQMQEAKLKKKLEKESESKERKVRGYSLFLLICYLLNRYHSLNTLLVH